VTNPDDVIKLQAELISVEKQLRDVMERVDEMAAAEEGLDKALRKSVRHAGRAVIRAAAVFHMVSEAACNQVGVQLMSGGQDKKDEDPPEDGGGG